MSINVYGIENKQVLSLRFTDNKKEKHINLLYKIHAMTALDTLRGSEKIYRVSWARRLVEKRTKNFSAIDKYNKKS